jgi:hypothetical protein
VVVGSSLLWFCIGRRVLLGEVAVRSCVIPDQGILENRVQAMRELPWVIPALVIIEMTDENLDLLDAA